MVTTIKDVQLLQYLQDQALLLHATCMQVHPLSKVHVQWLYYIYKNMICKMGWSAWEASSLFFLSDQQSIQYVTTVSSAPLQPG